MHAQVYFDTSNYYFYISDTPTITITDRNLPFTHSLLIAGPKVRSVKSQTDTSCSIDMETHLNENKQIGPGPCYANDKAGLIGRKIVETPDSIIVYNQHFEPLVINLNAPLYEPYIAFSNDMMYVTLEKLQSQEKLVIDTLLEVDLYKINVFKLDSTPSVSNKFHGKIIGISKGHGLVFTPNLSYFPYTLVSTYSLQLAGITSYAKQINRGYTYYTNPLTLFEVGDEFHTYSSYFNVTPQASSYLIYTSIDWIRKIVTKKTLLSVDSISYEYTVEHANKTSERISKANVDLPIKDTFSRVTYTATYILKTKYIPQSVPFEYFDERMISTFATGGEFTSSFIVNDYFKVVGFKYDGYTFHFQDSVWCMGFSDHTTRTTEYTGIGIPKFQSFSESSSYTRVFASLAYVKKNGLTWGSPFSANVGFQEQETQAIRVYPNPADQLVYIDSDREIQSLEMFNTEGKKAEVPFSANTVDVSRLSNGLYLIKIIFANEQVLYKRLAVHH
jgi:hypothetical protein